MEKAPQPNEANYGTQGSKAKVIGQLSIEVAPYKRGDIVVREGQEDDRSLSGLVKNFIVCYGLKRDSFPLIFKSLKNNISKNN